MVNVVNVYSLGGLARKAGITSQTLRQHIARGALVAERTIDGMRVVAQHEAERWLAARSGRLVASVQDAAPGKRELTYEPF